MPPLDFFITPADRGDPVDLPDHVTNRVGLKVRLSDPARDVHSHSWVDVDIDGFHGTAMLFGEERAGWETSSFAWTKGVRGWCTKNPDRTAEIAPFIADNPHLFPNPVDPFIYRGKVVDYAETLTRAICHKGLVSSALILGCDKPEYSVITVFVMLADGRLWCCEIEVDRSNEIQWWDWVNLDSMSDDPSDLRVHTETLERLICEEPALYDDGAFAWFSRFVDDKTVREIEFKTRLTA